MPPESLEMHPATIDPARLLAQCEQKFTRRSGPGGQNRNKVETAVILTHPPTGFVAEASERRTQGENREAALARLRILMALEIRTPPGLAGPSPLWRSRCRGGKVSVSPEHVDFPALLAEALDAVAAAGFDPKAAGERLGCTASQLLKLLKLEPRAFTLLNRERAARGLRPLL
jgi:hypothetical protein